MTDTTEPQNEIAELDRAWEMRRQSLLVRGRWGNTSVPRAALGLLECAFAVVFGALWMTVAGPASAPRPVVLFGLVFIFAGITHGILVARKAANYREAERSYLRDRDALLRGHTPKTNG